MHLMQRLEQLGVAHPPRWLTTNVAYLTVTGSTAYGCAADDSDLDIYGFCFPPLEQIFPHLGGEIPGFGRQLKRFEQYQEHHLADPSARGGRGQSYDLTVYAIVKFFQLCLENNPNMLDALFTPRECVVHATAVSERVRERRRLFLHKGAWHKFRGYAHSQLAKMRTKTPEPGSRRAEVIATYGYDLKYAVHLVRLVLECEQILVEGDIDLQRHAELLKTIRSGAWSETQVFSWFADKERELEPLYHSATAVPYQPDEAQIKDLLLECLEHNYGSLSKAVVSTGRAEATLRDIRQLLDQAGVGP